MASACLLNLSFCNQIANKWLNILFYNQYPIADPTIKHMTAEDESIVVAAARAENKVGTRPINSIVSSVLSAKIITVAAADDEHEVALL